MQQQSRTEFAQALRAIAAERNLDVSVILDTLKQAMIAAFRRDSKERGEDTETLEVDVTINPVNGEARVFAWPLEKPDEKKDVTPPGFGRIAAQTAKQVIHQKIREAEKDAVMGEFTTRAGGLISGMILRFEGSDVRIDLGKTEGVMPSIERVPNERLTLNQRMTFLLKEIVDTLRGKQIILSRADTAFVKKLFEREVPEIGSGTVVVKVIVREAGVRTKIAVVSLATGVDPVGSCVGQKGVRVQAVTNELGGERVDIISYSDNAEEFIKASLSPADGLIVELDKKKQVAIVKCGEDKLSIAIGKDGQNVRLASKLTGWKIEVKGLPQEKKDKVTDKETEEKKPEDAKKKKSQSLRKNVESAEKEAVAKEKDEIVPESELGKLEKKVGLVIDDQIAQPTQTATDDLSNDGLLKAESNEEVKKESVIKEVVEENPE